MRLPNLSAGSLPASERFPPFFGLVGWLAACFVAATVGAIASLQAESFYATLAQPDWAPPAWVFGPVWTTLYTLMAIAAWLVWQVRKIRLARVALVLFLLQLVLNTLWTWLFFRWHQGALAFVDSLVLWALITVTLILFWRIRPLAGALLIPYLLWVSFALALNYSIWQLNPSQLA
jgi:translocator protein